MSPTRTTSLACLLVLFAVAQAHYQFSLTNYIISPQVNYNGLFNLPSSNGQFLFTTDLLTHNFELASTSSLAGISNLTYNGQPIANVKYGVQYPKINPTFLYVIVMSSQGLTYSLLKIDTTSLQVVGELSVPDLGEYGTYFMDLNADGSVLYALGLLAGDRSFALNLFVISTSSLTLTQNIDLKTTVPEGISAFGVSSQSLYLFASTKVYILDITTAAIKQTYTLTGGLFSAGNPVYVDEANNALYTGTSADAGELIYTETFQLTKFSLNPFAIVSTISTFDGYGVGFVDFLLVDTTKGIAYFGCESQGLYYGTQVWPQSPPLLVAVNTASWSVVGYTVEPGVPAGYTAGRQYTAIFSDSSMSSIIIASGALLGVISIDSLSNCLPPTFTQTLSSQSSTSGTFSVTITNPFATQTITDFRFSACNQTITSVTTLNVDAAFDNTCGVPNGHYFSLPAGTVLPPSGSITFTYMNSNSATPLAFHTEYITCTSPSSSSPTSAPPSSPTTAPPSSCPITITQTVSSEWTQGGVRNAVYNVVFVNTGATTISSITVTLDAGVSSAWALVENNDHTYGLPAYGAMAPGAQFAWGYTRSGDGSATITISGCNPSTTTPTNAPPTSPTSTPTNAPTIAAPTAAPGNPTNGACSTDVSQYAQNAITAVAFSPTTGYFYPYVAHPGSSGYGYSLQDCQIALESAGDSHDAAFCEYAYVGNSQPIAFAVSSAKVGVQYTYGLGIGDNASAIALASCNCAIANYPGVTCSLVSLGL